MKRILLASVAALGLAGTASAADLAVKAPVVYAPVFTWTGCYLGINGGWIGGNDDYTTQPWGNWLIDATPAERAEVTNSYSTDETAGTAGGQFGCQVQFGSIVLGGEWDWNWSGLSEDNTFAFATTPHWFDRNEWTHKELSYFTTLRGRLGFAWDRVLIYATGGVAMAAFDASSRITFPDAVDVQYDYFAAYHERRIGWTVGGGLEWAFANNWTAKAEFLYLDFGSFDFQGIESTSPAGFANQTRTWKTDIDAKEYVARVGINYLFHTGGAPVVAKY